MTAPTRHVRTVDLEAGLEPRHPSAIILELEPVDRRTLLERLGYPSAMVTDPAVSRQLAELEQLTPGYHRRAMVKLAIEDREDELTGYADAGTQLVDLRIDDELLNGLLLILALLP